MLGIIQLVVKTICTPCPEGYYSDVKGTTKCGLCPQGTYSYLASSLCFKCPPGTYSDEGASYCYEYD